MAAQPFHFDAKMVAHYEVEGWKAYYDRNWLRLLRLIVALDQAQFRIPFPQSVIAAYYIVRASVVFVPKDHDSAAVCAYLAQFYRLARRYSGLTFDPEQAARLETIYWDVHRKLVRLPDKTEFIEAMTALHAAIFGLTSEQARESGELRVEANNVLDTITGHTSPDPVADWRRCEDLLARCYSSLERQKATVST
ncbi:MAG TPA: hypothetical protein VHD90_12275 [Phototrophicaceae bacterium]|nr:hypothetical protein [Phototrophicaceae bacterium]